MALVRQSEFAQLNGIDKAHVTRLKQAGRLVMDGKLVDVEASLALIRQTAHGSFVSKLVKGGVNSASTTSQRPAETGLERVANDSVGLPNLDQQKNAEKPAFLPNSQNDQTERATMSLQTARAVKENYNARMAKLDYERESGKLIDADAARLFAADLGATFRATLEILPDRIAAELVPLNNIEAIRATLVEAFEHVLLDLAHKISKWGNDEK